MYRENSINYIAPPISVACSSIINHWIILKSSTTGTMYGTRGLKHVANKYCTLPCVEWFIAVTYYSCGL